MVLRFSLFFAIQFFFFRSPFCIKKIASKMKFMTLLTLSALYSYSFNGFSPGFVLMVLGYLLCSVPLGAWLKFLLHRCSNRIKKRRKKDWKKVVAILAGCKVETRVSGFYFVSQWPKRLVVFEWGKKKGSGRRWIFNINKYCVCIHSIWEYIWRLDVYKKCISPFAKRFSKDFPLGR